MDLRNENFQNLDKFFESNKGICLKTINLKDDQEIERLSFKRVKKNKDDIVTQLKAWKRLLKILPECDRQEDIIKGLLKKNIHSAVQIASIPKQQFIKECRSIFNDDNLLETAYKNANAVKTQVLLKHINLKQNSEPHINATIFHK